VTCKVCGSSVAGFKDSEETTCYECVHFPHLRPLQPTAYDREQHALHARVTELEKRDHTAWHVPLVNLSDRLNAALQRIEQLELAVAEGGGYTPAGSAHVCGACRTDHQVLADRLSALERDGALDRGEAIKSEKRLEALESCAVGTSGSLVDARRRIEQLEADVARLKEPREPVPFPPATHLPCGCWNDVHGCRGHAASPATAYPPLPDEGT
jgi:hypothetical protein